MHPSQSLPDKFTSIDWYNQMNLELSMRSVTRGTVVVGSFLKSTRTRDEYCLYRNIEMQLYKITGKKLVILRY